VTLVGKNLGKFQIVAEIGQGGMGVVYRGYDPQLKRAVAIKVLAPELTWDPRLVARFRREAQTVAALFHPNIVNIHDIREQDGIHYLVMDLISGQPLSTLIAREGPLPPERAARIIVQLADALDYAHSRGVIHRDIKPANILVEAEDRVVLTDFGIAKAVGAEQLTMTGVRPGTPQYMSPEQAQGKPVDGRTDVYSLGVVLYEMLTGRLPYRADTPVNLMRVVARTPPRPPRQWVPAIPVEAERVVLRALAKDSQARYPSAGGMARALTQALAPRPPKGPGRSVLDERRTVRLLGAVTGVLLLALIVSLIVALGDEDDEVAAWTETPTQTRATPATATTVVPGGRTPTATATPGTPSPSPSASPSPTGETASPPPVTRTASPTPSPSGTPTATRTPSRTPTPKPQAGIAFSASQGGSNVDIYRMNPDGSGVVRLTTDTAYDSGPDWSPDGMSVAFHSNRRGNYDIYVTDRQGEAQTLRRLTSHGANDWDPSWSPDGSQIAFMSDRSGNREIYVMNSDGSNVRQLTNTAGSAGAPKSERQPAWSPKGGTIAFESRRTGTVQIFLMNPNGQNQRALTNSAGPSFLPKWSPDGARIVFASTRDPVNDDNNWPEIYVMNATGGGLVRLTSNRADDEAPAWSPDGKWIVFSSRRHSCANRRDDGGCDWDLYLIRPDGSGVTRLTDTPNRDEYNPIWWGP
jgi:serine/threonine protein kinase/Tol biopolymer transport system component